MKIAIKYVNNSLESIMLIGDENQELVFNDVTMIRDNEREIALGEIAMRDRQQKDRVRSERSHHKREITGRDKTRQEREIAN